MCEQPIKFRPLNYQKDVKRIVQLERELFNDPFLRGQLYFYYKKYSTKGSFVATIDSIVNGYIFCIREGDSIHIYTIGVANEFQRRGIGRKLIRLLKRMAIEEGLQVVLEVSANNLPAIKLYLSEEFVTTGSEEGYYPDGSTALYMSYSPDSTNHIDNIDTDNPHEQY